jgi:predicted phosphodiesterase
MAGRPQSGSIADYARLTLAAYPHLATPADLYAQLIQDYPAVAEASRKATLITCQRALAQATPPPSLVEGILEEAEETEGASEPWTVVDNNYTWRSGGGAFCRSVEEVDEMFFEYSRHGLNKTQVQMINDHGLSMWEWNTLKQRLLLQKNANVFSPYTVSITPANEMQGMMEAKMARRYEKQGPLIERAHLNAAVSELNRKMGQLDQRDAALERISLALSDMLPTLKYRYITGAPKVADGPDWFVATIADPHAGADVKELLNAPRYSREVLFQYADQFIERVNKRGAANVVLAGLGDFVESFSGMNHENTFLSLNKDAAGAGGIFLALEFFAYLIERIHNVREIWGVSGNHDRTSASGKLDTKGEAAHLLFFLLKERYGRHGISIQYRHDVLVREVDGICYLLTHGHLGLAKGDKNMQATIARHRIPGLYCVVLQAHLHSRITKMDTEDYCVRHSPSFFTGNAYSSDGGWSTLAGFLTSENRDGSGFPRVIDEPLYAARFSSASQATQSIV